MNLDIYLKANHKQAEQEISCSNYMASEIKKKITNGELVEAECYLDNLRRSIKQLKQLERKKQENDQVDMVFEQIKGDKNMNEVLERVMIANKC